VGTGDVIATAARGILPGLIRWRTGSAASHVALVARMGREIGLIETQKVALFRGRVVAVSLADRVAEWEAAGTRAWWLRLAPEAWARMDKGRFRRCVERQVGRGYDLWGAICSGTILEASPDAERLFCSESVALAFRKAGLLPRGFNFSEANPGDVVSWPLWDRCEQLCGPASVLGGWGRGALPA